MVFFYISSLIATFIVTLIHQLFYKIDTVLQLRQEFASTNAGQVQTQRDQWSKSRENILQLAKDKAFSYCDLQQVLDEETDENDDE
jgi:hypothetical protein